MKTKKFQGFTLLELMITVAIIGIIAAIAIPAYKGYISTSHQTQCQNEVAAIKLAESEYFLEKNSYFSGTGVTNLKTQSGSIYSPSTTALGTNTSSHKECDYSVTSSSTAYTITAKGTMQQGGNLVAGKTYVTVTGP